MKRRAQDYTMNLSEFYRRKRQQLHVTSFSTCSSCKGFQAWLCVFLRIFRAGCFFWRHREIKEVDISYSLLNSCTLEIPHFCRLSLYLHCLSSWLERLTSLSLVTIVYWKCGSLVFWWKVTGFSSWRDFRVFRSKEMSENGGKNFPFHKWSQFLQQYAVLFALCLVKLTVRIKVSSVFCIAHPLNLISRFISMFSRLRILVQLWVNDQLDAQLRHIIRLLL